MDILPTIDAGSVQTCVTSPPYWGLRDYGTASWEGGDAGCEHVEFRHTNGLGPSGLNTDVKDKEKRLRMCHANKFAREIQYRDICGKCGARRIDSQVGLEATAEEYISNMVSVFREVWRVLKDDGTLWVNMGDSYNANQGNGFDTHDKIEARSIETREKAKARNAANASPKMSSGLRPKNLVGMPWRLAFALQADGWYLRSDIIWHKPNPMPESVTDRPTKAHDRGDCL